MTANVEFRDMPENRVTINGNEYRISKIRTRVGEDEWREVDVEHLTDLEKAHLGTLAQRCQELYSETMSESSDSLRELTFSFEQEYAEPSWWRQTVLRQPFTPNPFLLQHIKTTSSSGSVNTTKHNPQQYEQGSQILINGYVQEVHLLLEKFTTFRSPTLRRVNSQTSDPNRLLSQAESTSLLLAIGAKMQGGLRFEELDQQIRETLAEQATQESLDKDIAAYCDKNSGNDGLKIGNDRHTRFLDLVKERGELSRTHLQAAADLCEVNLSIKRGGTTTTITSSAQDCADWTFEWRDNQSRFVEIINYDGLD